MSWGFQPLLPAAGAGPGTTDGLADADGVGGSNVVGAAIAAPDTVTAGGTSAASAVGAQISVLFPDGDAATDGWVDEVGGTSNIFQSINEAAVDDANYVKSPAVLASSANLFVRLYDGATMIVEWEHTGISSTFTTATQTLTTPQFEAITDFANLFVELDDSLGNVYRFPITDPAAGMAEPIKLHYRYKKLAA